MATRSFCLSGGETPDGTVISTKDGPDPRFGIQSPVLEEALVTLPSSLESRTTVTRDVETSQGDLLGLIRQTDVITTNGRQFESAFLASTRETTPISAEGRRHGDQ